MATEITSLAPAVADIYSQSGGSDVKRFTPAQPTAAASQPGPAEQPTAKPERRQVEAAVAELRERMQMLRTSIQFSIDDDTDKMVIKVIDVEKQQVILQLPPAYMLALAKLFAGDKFSGDKSARALPQGLLIQDKA